MFEPIDGYDWKHNHFAIPNEIFSNKKDHKDRMADGILDIFDRYNFTMSEDEPLEREVAIDPEMLGKVFENLLDVNDRKSKGAFYTPREIVHYMCQESLINYLTNTMKVSEMAIRDFILYGDFMKDEDASVLKRAEKGDSYALWVSEELYELNPDGTIKTDRMIELDKALQDVRVADPAVGSGAFPLGMLNEIVRARQNITTYMDITQKIIDPKGASREIRYRRINDRSAHQLKYDTIRNCIFAVDIEPSAVDIAQLRLWLALVIDDEIDPYAISALDGHRNPLPLPNLECNILCGNSLIDEFEGIKLINESDIIGTASNVMQVNLYQSAFDATLQRLIDKQQELFKCDNTEKKLQLLQDIDALREDVIMSQLRGQASADQFERYYGTKTMASKPFILWQLDFARVFLEKGGFDIVIGNPPYIGESGHKDIFRAVAETSFGHRCYQGKMDFFYFFFHKALDILHQNGFCGLITTNYFLSASGAKTLRSDFMNRACLLKLINFNEFKIFTSALGQHNIITLLNKSPQKSVDCCITNRKGVATTQILNSIVQGHDKETLYFSMEASEIYDDQGNIVFHAKDPIITKMKSHASYLIDKKNVGGGIDILQEQVVERHLEIDNTLTVGKGIFAVEESEIEDLNLSERERTVLKPYYTSEQIKKYFIAGKNHKWIIYTDKYVCDHIEEYPNIKKHLDQFQKVITSDNKPYGLHRPRVESQFQGEKLLSLRMTREPCFTYTAQDTYVTRAYLTIKLDTLDYKYALGVLNSRLMYYWFFNEGKRKGKQLQIDQAQISEAPIELGTVQDQNEIIEAVESLLNSNASEGISENESRINEIVYRIYGLTDEEIMQVDQFVKTQRGE